MAWASNFSKRSRKRTREALQNPFGVTTVRLGQCFARFFAAARWPIRLSLMGLFGCRSFCGLPPSAFAPPRSRAGRDMGGACSSALPPVQSFLDSFHIDYRYASS